MAECSQSGDADLADAALLWRFLRPNDGALGWWVIDQQSGRPRPSSFSFEDDAGGAPLSVTIASESPSLDAALGSFISDGVVSITVADVRECGFTVKREPIEGNPAHAVLVTPPGTSRNRRRRMSGCLAERARWVRPAQSMPSFEEPG